MSHTYAQNVVHVVFSTKNRRKEITEDLQPRLWAYAAGVCRNIGVLVHAIGGMEDHLHLLLQVPPILPVAKAVSAVKSNSSRWAREEGHSFAWQEGYGAFSVSHSNVPVVIRYIRSQKAHHKKMGFAEEFLALLKRHSVGFDSKYVLG